MRCRNKLGYLVTLGDVGVLAGADGRDVVEQEAVGIGCHPRLCRPGGGGGWAGRGLGGGAGDLLLSWVV